LTYVNASSNLSCNAIRQFSQFKSERGKKWLRNKALALVAAREIIAG
jgi:hypothetical protein